MPARKIRKRKARVASKLSKGAFSGRAGKSGLATKAERDAVARRITSKTNAWAKKTMKGVC